MGCPRCPGSLTTYALGERESVVCEECGWVGIETTLEGEESSGPSESWAEAMDRGPNQQGTIDRSGIGLPPIVTRESRVDEKPSDPMPDSQRAESGPANATRLVEQLDGLEPEIAEELATAGIESLEELASADAAGLAGKTKLDESTLQSYSRKAAIQLVTSPSMESPED